MMINSKFKSNVTESTEHEISVSGINGILDIVMGNYIHLSVYIKNSGATTKWTIVCSLYLIVNWRKNQQNYKNYEENQA